MGELTDETLMGLAEFCKVMHSNPSTERRMRREEQDWPPHLCVGRKIFYIREGVRDFLARRQDANGLVRPEVGVAVESPVGEVALEAPALTVEQKKWLQAIFGPQLGDGS